MSRNNEALLEEARLLLPWYLTGQLSAAEKELVDNALIQFPELKDELAHEEQMKKLVCQDAQLLELAALDTTPQRLDNLLKRIAREDEQKQDSIAHTASVDLARPIIKPTTNTHATKPSRWGKWFSELFSAEWLTPANAVLAGLLVCQVGAGGIYYYLSHQQANVVPTSYSTASIASGEVCDTSGSIKIKLIPNDQLAYVDFKDSTTVEQVRTFLQTNNMELLQTPPSNNPDMYLIKFTSTLEATDNYVKQIRTTYDNILEIFGKADQSDICS
jgi:hypothetical protein